MKNMCKRMVGFSVSLLIMMSATFMAFGAKSDEEERQKLTGVSIRVESTVEADTDLGTVSATATNAHYSVASCDFIKTGQSWKAGEVPKVKIVVNADSGYYFKSGIGGGSVKLKGATYSSIKRLDSGETLEITVKLKAVKGNAGDISDAYWSDSAIGKASWDSADNADAYELKLYRDSSMVKHIDSITGTSYNFYPYMTKVGDYTFMVRGIPRNGRQEGYLEEGEWTESEELYIDSKDASKASSQSKTETSSPGSSGTSSGAPANGPDEITSQAGWYRNNSGWWYQDSDGKYPNNEWKYIDNKWYLFDLNGYMKTGWQVWNNQYYYMTTNGDMVTGWFEENRKWYYLGEDGVMRTGWSLIDNQWYYFNQDGSRATGWVRWGSNWYYLNPADGVMVRNTVIDGVQINENGERIS